MADRQLTPNLGKTLAGKAGLFVVAAIFTVPALAATGSRIPCSEAVEATLTVSDKVLITEAVSHDLPAPEIEDDTSINEIETISSSSLLAPRAEAAIRDAFEEIDSSSQESATDLSKTALTPPIAGTTTEVETAREKSEGPARGMNTKLPGISDDALLRYKKQMYRRDI